MEAEDVIELVGTLHKLRQRRPKTEHTAWNDVIDPLKVLAEILAYGSSEIDARRRLAARMGTEEDQEGSNALAEAHALLGRLRDALATLEN